MVKVYDDTEEYRKKISQLLLTIKYTYDITDTELTFIDVIVYKEDRFQTTNILDLKTHIKTPINNSASTPHHTINP